MLRLLLNIFPKRTKFQIVPDLKKGGNFPAHCSPPPTCKFLPGANTSMFSTPESSSIFSPSSAMLDLVSTMLPILRVTRWSSYKTNHRLGFHQHSERSGLAIGLAGVTVRSAAGCRQAVSTNDLEGQPTYVCGGVVLQGIEKDQPRGDCSRFLFAGLWLREEVFGPRHPCYVLRVHPPPGPPRLWTTLRGSIPQRKYLSWTPASQALSTRCFPTCRHCPTARAKRPVASKPLKTSTLALGAILAQSWPYPMGKGRAVPPSHQHSMIAGITPPEPQKHDTLIHTIAAVGSLFLWPLGHHHQQQP